MKNPELLSEKQKKTEFKKLSKEFHDNLVVVKKLRDKNEKIKNKLVAMYPEGHNTREYSLTKKRKKERVNCKEVLKFIGVDESIIDNFRTEGEYTYYMKMVSNGYD
jgi:hypothetical protein